MGVGENQRFVRPLTEVESAASVGGNVAYRNTHAPGNTRAMEELRKQVRRARRRLTLQRLVTALGWCLTATLSLAMVLIVVGKFRPLGVSDAACLAAATVLGVLAASVWSLSTGSGAINAAMEIDRRFGLKERVSSALALSDEDRESESGRALVADAVRRVGRIDVAERLRVVPGRPLLFPLLPTFAALLIALFVSPGVVENPAQAKTDPAAVKKQVEATAKRLQQRLDEKRAQAEKLGLRETENVLKLLQQGAKELSAKPPGDQKRALVKMNDLAKQLQSRRDKAGGAEKIKEKLNQMRDFKPGPADKFARAVKQGDFKKAIEELNTLKEQLEDGSLDKPQREQLAEQLEQMQEKLQKMTEAHKQAQEELTKKIDQLRAAGRQDEANELEEQLDTLRQQMPQIDQLNQLANELGQCAQCLKDGQMKDADAALGELQEGLKALQQQADEIEMLDDAMDQLAQCRNAMGCKRCGGAGCSMCMGDQFSDGFGLGEGRGAGDRPEEKTDTATRDSQVRQQVGRGAMVVSGYVDGPSKKGQVNEEIKSQLEAVKHQTTDPLGSQRMPRKHQEHTKAYFDHLREGQ